MLKVYEEKSIMEMYYNNEFWSGAKTTLENFDKLGRLEEVCDYIEDFFENCYDDKCIDITMINDFIWFDLEDLLEYEEEIEE